MNGELDSGTLLLLILIGYGWWRAVGSIGNSNSGLGSGKGSAIAPISSSNTRSSDLDAHDITTSRHHLVGATADQAPSAIRIGNQTINAAHFINGAVAAYETILDAFAKGDAAVLAELTSADVYEAFVEAIAQRENESRPLELTLLRVSGATIVDVASDAQTASITVRFSGQFTACRRGDDLAEGTAPKSVDLIDLWTFARKVRSRHPNWTLVATRSA